VETTVFAQYLLREHNFLRYANWKRNGKEGEVDLIQLSTNFQKVHWALEVKWSDSPKVDKLRYFMKTNDVDRGIITSKTVFDNSSNILITPTSIYAYVVGKNALDSLDSDF
ncbi:MAG: hypothetical protein ACI857_003229, partial [Arenicella sp.]